MKDTAYGVVCVLIVVGSFIGLVYSANMIAKAVNKTDIKTESNTKCEVFCKCRKD